MGIFKANAGNSARTLGLFSENLSDDSWTLPGGEVFIHSAIFESEPGDLNVDSGWADLDDPGLARDAAELRRCVESGADGSQALALEVISKLVGTKVSIDGETP